MSITGIDNFAPTTVAGIICQEYTTTPPNLCLEGYSDGSWMDYMGGQGSQFPTPYYELVQSSHPTYHFIFTQRGWVTPNLTIYATVKCYVRQQDQSLQLATTTNHSFRFGDGYRVSGSSSKFCTKYSCLYLTEEEGKCEDLQPIHF